MGNLFLCRHEGSLRPIQLITTVFYDKNPNIGKSIYLDCYNGKIITRYFETSRKKGKLTEMMIMQDSPYGYDLSETPYLPCNDEDRFNNILCKEILKIIKEKLTFTPNEIKKINEYRFGTTKKR